MLLIWIASFILTDWNGKPNDQCFAMILFYLSKKKALLRICKYKII